MTDTIRGPLLTAQREISALDLKRRKVLEKLTENENKEKGAYVNATTMLETVQNAAIKTGFVSVHAKLKTELAMVDVQIKDYQQLFGLEMYQIFADLEDMEGWLPTVRDIRSIYDQVRRDVDKIQVRRKEKEKELEKIGGVPMTTDSECSKYNVPTSVSTQQNEKKNEVADEYFRQAANTTLANAQLGPPAVGIPPTMPSSISVSGLPYSEKPAGSNFASQQQVQAAPISAPVQSYGSNSVAYQDPFAPSNYGASTATVVPFATGPAVVANGGNTALGFMSDDSSQRPYGGGPAMGTVPAMGLGYGGGPAMGNVPAMGSGGGPVGAFGFMTDDSQRSSGSYGPAMGTGPAIGAAGGNNLIRPGPFAPVPPSAASAAAANNNNDPFAAFDILQQQTPHQQQTPSENPLFRY
jgi:hypothetical protein